MDIIVTLSNDMKLYYEQQITNTQIKCIHTGHKINPNDSIILEEENDVIINFKTKYNITLGIIANLTNQKGINQVIKAIALDSKLCLIIIGNGKEYKNLIKLAKKLNCINRCLFLGHKNYAYNYIKYFDIYVMSSYQEGFGLVTLEAAYFSKPLLCSNIPIFNEIFSNNEVEYFNLNNTNSLIQGVYNLFLNYEHFSIALNNLYKKNYTTEIMASSYKKLYLNSYYNK
jgi:glycosyltransferase involved in cell wall biosynthesis